MVGNGDLYQVLIATRMRFNLTCTMIDSGQSTDLVKANPFLCSRADGPERQGVIIVPLDAE